MPATANDGDAVGEFVHLSVPADDASVRAHDPISVVSVQKDGNVAERAAPLYAGGVEVGVGDGDRRHSAQSFDGRHRGVIDAAAAIPQDIARVYQEGMLADAEPRPGTDHREAGLDLVEVVLVFCLHVIERRPLLPREVDVLTFVIADGAAIGRRVALRMLDAAGNADECRHDRLMLTRSTPALSTLP